MDNMNLISTFMRLVQIDSETKFEQQMADVLQHELQTLGFEVLCDQLGPTIGHQAGNMFATLPATEGFAHVPKLLFTCHMDTVTPGRRIQPRMDADGYIRSDGTTILGADDKAGIAAFLQAIETIQANHEPHGEIRFVVTVAEESGLLGSGLLTPDSVTADYGFALDSNGKVGEIVTAAPTTTKLVFEIQGKKAHAGVNPEAGISAIQVAGVAISRMQLGRIDAQTTANLGKIEGGEQTNIVCDYVLVTAEARSLNAESGKVQVEGMKAAFREAAQQFGAMVTIDEKVMYPAFELAADSPVVALAARAAAMIGRSPMLVQSGGGSDANHFNRIGIPMVNLAIGYEHIHTTREQMPVEELVKTAELVRAIIIENNKEVRDSHA
jgi:tripeptide aminopeptidase